MSPFTESTLESAIAELLLQQGYKHYLGSNLKRSKREVVLRDVLVASLQTRYQKQGITSEEVMRAADRLCATPEGNLYDANRATHSLFTEGFFLSREDSSLPDLYIRPIDWEDAENNDFCLVTQLEVQGTELRRPDGVLYVNGLPLVVLEFKSAVREEATLDEAYRQVKIRYGRDIPELMRFAAFVVLSDGANSKYGTQFSSYDYFYSWPKLNSTDEAAIGIDSLQTLIGGLLSKERLLSVVRDFVFFPDSGQRETKIICRYPQFFATHKLYDHILKHARFVAGGDGRGGTYFGTTGCGKSLTMLFLTRQLMRSRELASPTIILITDRTDLDQQLSVQFSEARQFIGDDQIVSIQSRRQLRELLGGRKSGGVFLTTIHKFNEDTDLLSHRANIICISDEAHRSQTNLQEKLTTTEEGVRRSYGFAHHLHRSLPNATYVGFTGTPIDATIEVFGEVVDTYTMTESVADGITRRIVYEGRAARILPDAHKVNEIEVYYKQCEQEGSTPEQIEASKRAVTQMERILGDVGRLRMVAEDFIKHYEGRIEEGSSVCGKAMIVCMNRRIAYALYLQLIALRPEWEQDGFLHLVMTRHKDDTPKLYQLLGTDEDRQALAQSFKQADSAFKIAIVVDMWITGFDAPCLDTMYIDKPLQRHALIQTISRVNRVYSGKEKGLVVDYIGIKSALNAALKQYATGGEEDFLETNEQALRLVKDELDILRGLFYGFDWQPFSQGKPLEQLDCLKLGAEFVQEKQLEARFLGHCRKLRSAFKLCSGSEELEYLDREDIHFFIAVRSILVKLSGKADAPDMEQMNSHVEKMISEALRSECVEEILQIGEEEQLDLLSEAYMQRIERLPYPHTKVKLMERLLKQVIKGFRRVNKFKALDFTKRLNDLIARYNDRRDSAVFAEEVVNEVAQQMSDMLRDLHTEKNSFAKLGISYEEKAFYDILKAIAQQFGFEYPEEKLLLLSARIKDLIDDKSSYTDWSTRGDIKAELKMDLIVLLSEHDYPPVTNDAVFKEILEQAENFKQHQ
ncbi:type I restriction endonuclease subunit R [Mogibacterium diversum]|uniref:type I restriction endonuclease subunit R n=1 Tax=Mogibacterium diversum TaxID=114527 RepID=UPI0028D5EA01|nr:type I restriction endonuclease subunit R [Mogibacterium diversum]